MPPDRIAPLNDVQRQLEMTHSQLALYARDLKRIVAVERQQREELADAHARLKILDRLKTDFLMFISHELRTPLNFLSAVDLIDPEAGAPAGQSELFDAIRSGYQWLDAFISRGLDYFNWLATEPIRTEATMDLSAIVRDVCGRTRDRTDRTVTLEVCLPELPCVVHAKEEPVAQVVQIIVDNAVKFSPPGASVTVVLRCTNAVATLTVTDHGRGFPPEWAREIFQPFTIADAIHHSHGTGLSLALADAILRAHGAHIAAESRGLGCGAAFIVQFPGAQPQQEVAA